jgi:hypothetical protein
MATRSTCRRLGGFYGGGSHGVGKNNIAVREQAGVQVLDVITWDVSHLVRLAKHKGL